MSEAIAEQSARFVPENVELAQLLHCWPTYLRVSLQTKLFATYTCKVDHRIAVVGEEYVQECQGDYVDRLVLAIILQLLLIVRRILSPVADVDEVRRSSKGLRINIHGKLEFSSLLAEAVRKQSLALTLVFPNE